MLLLLYAPHKTEFKRRGQLNRMLQLKGKDYEETVEAEAYALREIIKILVTIKHQSSYIFSITKVRSRFFRGTVFPLEVAERILGISCNSGLEDLKSY